MSDNSGASAGNRPKVKEKKQVIPKGHKRHSEELPVVKGTIL